MKNRVDVSYDKDSVREILDRDDEREPYDLPKPTPIENLERSRLQPVPTHVRHRVPR
jgi:hypothetical protein